MDQTEDRGAPESVSVGSTRSHGDWRELWIPIALLAATALLALMFYLLVAALNAVDVVSWLPTFLTSPGFAGIAAVAAAVIGSASIMRQLRHSRAVQADAAWWKSFEWVTERALPMDPAHQRLPYELSISSLVPLRDTATTAAQEISCNGLLSHLIALRRIEESDKGPAERWRDVVTEPEQAQSETTVLKAYVTASAGSTSGSLSAEARIYELQAEQALSGIAGLERLVPQKDWPKFDAFVRFRQGRVVALDFKYVREGADRQRFRNVVAHLSRMLLDFIPGETPAAVLIITPVEVDLSSVDVPGPLRGLVHLQQWNGPRDTRALARKLRTLSEGP